MVVTTSSAPLARRLKEAALGPSPHVAERRRARWLAGLLLVIIGVFACLDTYYLVTTPGYAPPWVGYLLLGTAFALVRTGRYLAGALLTTGTIPLVALALIVTGRSAAPQTTLSLFVLAVMLSGVLLPVSGVVTVTLVELGVLGFLRFYLGSPMSGDVVIGPAVLVAMGGGIASLGAMLGKRIEHDRREVLVATNTELEERVRERTVDLQRANSELEAFSYSASHDLRTPLRAIDAHAALLASDLGDRIDDRTKQSIQRIRATTARMTELVDRMLELSKVGRTELKLEALDIAKIARDIADDLRAADPEHIVTLDTPAELAARGDPWLVRITLHNLLQNAWKFTYGRASPRVEIAADRGRNGEVTYRVRDNGVGFDPELSDKLFRPFQRLHRADEFAGNGIGTAIVARAIERHGGRVWAEAKVGEGATFYFTLGAPSARAA